MKTLLTSIPALLLPLFSSRTTADTPSTPIHIQITTPTTGNRTLTLIDDDYPFNGALTINATWAYEQPAEVLYHDGPVSLWYEEEGYTVHVVYALYASRANFTLSCPWTESTCEGDFELKVYGYPW